MKIEALRDCGFPDEICKLILEYKSYFECHERKMLLHETVHNAERQGVVSVVSYGADRDRRYYNSMSMPRVVSYAHEPSLYPMHANMIHWCIGCGNLLPTFDMHFNAVMKCQCSGARQLRRRRRRRTMPPLHTNIG